MGLYINPKNDLNSRSKRDTILKVGRRVQLNEFVMHNPGENDEYGIAICDNGFIATDIAFNKNEAAAFAHTYGNSVEYVILSIDQIAEIDQGCADSLKQYHAKIVRAVHD